MIDVTDHGPIREIRLNRPPANAFNPELVRTLADAIAEAPGGGAEAVVLSGAPGMFTGGLDVPELLTLDRPALTSFFGDFYGLMRAVAGSEVPIGAAITGHSPAAGAVTVAFCDHRVMAEGSFKIGMNEVQVGLAVPPVIQYAMKRLVGPRRGDALLLAGSLLTPDEALECGLVDRLAPPDGVVDAALEWAERSVALPREAMRQTRSTGRADLVSQFEGLDDAYYDAMAERWFGDETQRTMRALVERLAAR